MKEIWDIYDSNRNLTRRTHYRGDPMGKDDFHLVVHVWIVNSKGEFLISKRTPNKILPNMWECTGGAAVSGDDSLATALKETREELGITLVPKNGQLFKSYKRYLFDTNQFADVWLFRQDVDISSVVLNPEETCDAMWADKVMINQMVNDGSFIGREIVSYLDELFSFCERIICS